MLNDPAWEPLWAACNDTGMSVNTHGGGGEHYPYEGAGRTDDVHDGDAVPDPPRAVGDDLQRRLRALSEPQAGTHRAMGGLGADRDGRYGRALSRSRLAPPSAPSCPSRRRSTSARTVTSARVSCPTARPRWPSSTISIDNVMWGDDYPHAEGTFPDTREAMRFTFSDIDPKYTRKFLGETAIDLYGLDRDKLTGSPIGSARRSTRSPRPTRCPRTPWSVSTPSAPGRASSSERSRPGRHNLTPCLRGDERHHG